MKSWKKQLMKLFHRIKKKEKLNKKQRKLIFILKFLIRFSLLAIPLYLIMYFGNLFLLKVVETKQISILLNLTEIKNSVEINDEVILNVEPLKNKLVIDDACTGYRSMLAFAALVLAVPKIRNSKKSVALILGIPAIYVINILRIFSTILIAVKFGEEKLEFVHTFLWREGLIFLILILWLLWLNNVKEEISF
ncbi:MAG: exosortase/archaeosortase family protein [Candidatus Parvarchaeota archaeon]|nr:exosortase/archaeosortase family protein [Candidatus Jingweiarchaeum tengchongense]MCW1297863.1 exosortase/archaeosortase family protein [Candidatus Jingweiarchaeum tengchongense]MCW1310708.1 exosortase/archaeosortase family protein [Candidatus Jingweiarchaeum tengchongense]